jgi:hypothetical protein
MSMYHLIIKYSFVFMNDLFNNQVELKLSPSMFMSSLFTNVNQVELSLYEYVSFNNQV